MKTRHAQVMYNIFATCHIGTYLITHSSSITDTGISIGTVIEVPKHGNIMGACYQ